MRHADAAMTLAAENARLRKVIAGALRIEPYCLVTGGVPMHATTEVEATA
jgi:hypothetical protein